ncbi:MAG TPA: cupin domain-containing protein [Candidatus Limnocylindrales bacterium]|nr:cupin domain-containing protein [Candidatus Limnocylindrales bacterium]
MADPSRPRHVPSAELEPTAPVVTQAGGDVRLLRGAAFGLRTSVMVARIPPGVGPRPHRHPHAEIFVIHDGQARFEVEGETVEAQGGDIVIVPPEARHTFVNAGDTVLRHTAIHENPEPVTTFDDGSQLG